MKENKPTNKGKQLQINFDDTKSYKNDASFLVSNDSFVSKTTKVISFSDITTRYKSLKDEELRKFVVKNTKSF